MAISKQIQAAVDLVGYALFIAVRRQLTKPWLLTFWFLAILLYFSAGVMTLAVLDGQLRGIAGWSLAELTFLFGFGLISHAGQVIFFMQAWNNDDLVRNGEIDLFYCRPVGLLTQYFTSYFHITGIFDLVPAVIIVSVAASRMIPQITNAGWIALILCAVGAIFLRAAVYLLICVVGMKRATSRTLISVAMPAIERATLFPADIYPSAIKHVLTFVVPLALVSNIPTAAVLHGSTPYGNLWWSAFAVVFIGITGFGISVMLLRWRLLKRRTTGE